MCTRASAHARKHAVAQPRDAGREVAHARLGIPTLLPRAQTHPPLEGWRPSPGLNGAGAYFHSNICTHRHPQTQRRTAAQAQAQAHTARRAGRPPRCWRFTPTDSHSRTAAQLHSDRQTSRRAGRPPRCWESDVASTGPPPPPERTHQRRTRRAVCVFGWKSAGRRPGSC